MPIPLNSTYVSSMKKVQITSAWKTRQNCRGISHTAITIKVEAILKADSHSH